MEFPTQLNVPHRIPSITSKRQVAYNFEPFLSAPTMIKTHCSRSSIQMVHIPESTIPSPLANNIAPQAIQDLWKFLVGPQRPQKGNEIWESWKRAWDIWNNHYIEGRVDPVWVREEYEKLKKEYGEERKERTEKKQNLRRRGTGYHHNDGPPLKMKRPDQVTSSNKSSAGFFAMKDLPEYYRPEVPIGTNVRDSEVGHAIMNTVWRPRHVGETVVKIELDRDIECFLKNNTLQVDGGVDCGRSLYPVYYTPYPIIQLLTK
jgi:hypothetical protein